MGIASCCVVKTVYFSAVQDRTYALHRVFIFHVHTFDFRWKALRTALILLWTLWLSPFFLSLLLVTGRRHFQDHIRPLSRHTCKSIFKRLDINGKNPLLPPPPLPPTSQIWDYTFHPEQQTETNPRVRCSPCGWQLCRAEFWYWAFNRPL